MVEYLEFKTDGENINRAIFDVIDLLSGEKIAEYYHSSGEIGASLACYSGNGDFVFASIPEENHLSILHVSPK